MVVRHGFYGERTKMKLVCSWILSIEPPPPFFGTWTLSFYSPSQLILTFHLSIRQATTWVPISSAACLYFLLVAIIETTLFRGLFLLTWLGSLLTHSMWRWRIFPDPFPYCTPVRVPFHSHFLLGALWRLPLTTCYSSLGP